MESIIEVINWVSSMISDIPDTLDTFIERSLAWIFIAYLNVKISMMELAWQIAKPILEAISMSDVVQDALSALPPDVSSALAACRFFEAINMIAGAAMTRFVLGMMP